MPDTKKVLILGATGRTGRHVLNAALAAGYQVHVLVRDAEKLGISHPKCQVFEGHPADKQALESALLGCEYVLSTLNISRVNDFPWAPLRTPPTLLSEVMALLLGLAEVHPLKKLVLCSAWGARESRSDIPFWFRWLVEYSNIGPAYDDHGRQELLLEASRIPWTIVRPVALTNSLSSENVVIQNDAASQPNLLISRKSVAQFMVDALSRSDLDGKKPVIFAR